jgi:hypothetical protein
MGSDPQKVNGCIDERSETLKIEHLSFFLNFNSFILSLIKNSIFRFKNKLKRLPNLADLIGKKKQ